MVRPKQGRPLLRRPCWKVPGQVEMVPLAKARDRWERGTQEQLVRALCKGQGRLVGEEGSGS